MILTTLTRTELEDELATAKVDYQCARRNGDTYGMQAATSTMNAIHIELAMNNNVLHKVGLPHV